MKQFNTAFSIAFYVHGFAHAWKAAEGYEHRGLWSWKAAYAHCTALKEKYSRQDKVNRQQNKQLLSLVSRTTVAPVRMQNKHQHCLIPQKHFFYSGTFPVEAQEEPINLTKEFQRQKKINKQELGGDEVVSPPSLFYCRGD